MSCAQVQVIRTGRAAHPHGDAAVGIGVKISAAGQEGQAGLDESAVVVQSDLTAQVQHRLLTTVPVADLHIRAPAHDPVGKSTPLGAYGGRPVAAGKIVDQHGFLRKGRAGRPRRHQ